MPTDLEIATTVTAVRELQNAIAILTLPNTNAVSVGGVFDREWVESIGAGGYHPTFTGVSGDFPAELAVGMPVDIAGVAFTAAVVQPDGAGLTMVLLKSA